MIRITSNYHEMTSKIVEEAKGQFESGKRNTYGEPQAFVDMDNGRYIEVVIEQEGLSESEYYYTVRLHCSDKEWGMGQFYSTMGMIDEYYSNNINDEELEALIELVLKFNEKY